MKHGKNWIRLLCCVVTSLSIVQAVMSVIKDCNSQFAVEIWIYISLVLVVTICIFLANGFWLEGFLVRKAVIKLKSIGAEICIRKGDIFNQDGVAVIGVNDFFDTVVDDHHINSTSIHGQLITKYWPGRIQDLDAQIEQSIGTVSKNATKRDGVAKESRYEIGTSAFVTASSGHRFILTAISKTDPQTHKTQSSLELLAKAIRGAMNVARDRANGDPISFYVMGGGNARINASELMLFETILTTIISECLENGKPSCKINIVLSDASTVAAMNLYDIGVEWSL